jgi:hypothetical protein
MERLPPGAAVPSAREGRRRRTAKAGKGSVSLVFCKLQHCLPGQTGGKARVGTAVTYLARARCLSASDDSLHSVPPLGSTPGANPKEELL